MKYPKSELPIILARSPPSRAAWIEINPYFDYFNIVPRRRLHGRRGLKLSAQLVKLLWIASPPSRAAWIEISAPINTVPRTSSRRLHGRRGLKSNKHFRHILNLRRRLHGRRGLKYHGGAIYKHEMCRRLHGRRGLKYFIGSCLNLSDKSPPSRAAWIEIKACATI